MLAGKSSRGSVALWDNENVLQHVVQSVLMLPSNAAVCSQLALPLPSPWLLLAASSRRLFLHRRILHMRLGPSSHGVSLCGRDTLRPSTKRSN